MSEFIPRTVSATQGSSNSVATRWHPSGSGPREGGRRVAVGGGRGSRGITHFLRVHFLDLVDHTGDAAPEVVPKLVPATHTLRSGSPGLAADSERRCEIEHGQCICGRWAEKRSGRTESRHLESKSCSRRSARPTPAPSPPSRPGLCSTEHSRTRFSLWNRSEDCCLRWGEEDNRNGAYLLAALLRTVCLTVSRSSRCHSGSRATWEDNEYHLSVRDAHVPAGLELIFLRAD